MVIRMNKVDYLYANIEGLNAAERRRYKIEHHICLRCGKQFHDEQGRQICDKCRKKAKAEAKAKKAELRKQGLCLTCQSPLSDEDKAHHYLNCAHCRRYAATRAYMNKWKGRTKAEMFVEHTEKKLAAHGYPTHCQCGEPLEYGYLTCAKCREKARKRYYARKEKATQDTPKTEK